MLIFVMNYGMKCFDDILLGCVRCFGPTNFPVLMSVLMTALKETVLWAWRNKNGKGNFGQVMV